MKWGGGGERREERKGGEGGSYGKGRRSGRGGRRVEMKGGLLYDHFSLLYLHPAEVMV